MKFLPLARTENIAVQNLKDEVLIYDLTTNLAVCLNSTSANVFNACDGKTTFDELKAKHNYTDEIVYLALDGLKKENLIADEYISPFAGMNRREVIRKVGLASMIALPAITGIIAPRAVNAASGTCTSSASCPANRPVCATSGSATGQCCTAGSTSRGSSGTAVAGGSNPGTCASFDCNTAFSPQAASCCSGSLAKTCTDNGNNTRIYTCRCA